MRNRLFWVVGIVASITGIVGFILQLAEFSKEPAVPRTERIASVTGEIFKYYLSSRREKKIITKAANMTSAQFASIIAYSKAYSSALEEQDACFRQMKAGTLKLNPKIYCKSIFDIKADLYKRAPFSLGGVSNSIQRFRYPYVRANSCLRDAECNWEVINRMCEDLVEFHRSLVKISQLFTRANLAADFGREDLDEFQKRCDSASPYGPIAIK